MNFIQRVQRAIQFIGFWALFRTIVYSVYRDWLEWRFSKPRGNFSPKAPEAITKLELKTYGGVFSFHNNIHLEIEFLGNEVIRLTWTPGKMPAPYAIRENENQWQSKVALNIDQSNGAWTFTTPAMKIRLFDDGSIQYHSQTGKNLRRDYPPLIRDEQWSQKFTLGHDDYIFGLGERAGRLNLRGRSYRFWNRDPGGSYSPGDDPLYISIPVYIVLNRYGSYLIFHDNSHDGHISFDPINASVPLERSDANGMVVFSSGSLRTYFIIGEPEQALDHYTELTGKAPLPPRWALGFHQSRWGYDSEKVVRRIAKNIKKYDLPLSAIHLDIDYMQGYRVFTVDKKRFPDLTKLSNDLDAENIKLVSILDPGVKRDPEYEVYQDGLANAVFCSLPSSGKQPPSPVYAPVWPGWCAFPDFTNPKTREWWGEKYSDLLTSCIAGFWHDMNEPTAFASWGDLCLPSPTQHSLDGQRGDHTEGHNLYGLAMAQAGYEALRKFKPAKRPWLLSRSGWAGIQRYTWSWTGDTESSWEALRTTIATVLGLGLSGIPYSGPDIGGFSGDPDAELFTRWFQLATFMPFFRNHSAKGTPAREPWTFGEPTLSICRKFLNLRYHLLPYLYTIAWSTSQTGTPFIRPLFWQQPKNSNLWDVDDSFLLGDSLLVAPVFEQGASNRRIWLPRGRWFDFWKGTIVSNPDVVDFPAKLDTIPILARGGSIIPLEEGKRLIMHIYPNDAGQAWGKLYSDAGDGYREYRIDSIQMDHYANEYSIIKGYEGNFPFPYSEIEVSLHGTHPIEAIVDGEKIEFYDDKIRVNDFSKILVLANGT